MRVAVVVAVVTAVGSLAGCGSGSGACDPFVRAICIGVSSIRADVDYLADAERGGRAPATPQNEDAVGYVEDRFQSLGLTPAGDAGTYRQAFAFEQHLLLAKPAVTLGSTPLTYGTDFLTFGYSGSGNVTASVAFAGYGIVVPPFDAASYPDCPVAPTGYDDYAGIDVAGKIVVILRHGPADNEALADNCPEVPGTCSQPPCHWTFAQKARHAATRGARALMMVQHYANGPQPSGASVGRSVYNAHQDFPVVFVDRSRMEAALPSLHTWATQIDSSLAPASSELETRFTVSVSAEVKNQPTANVIGVIEGSDPVLKDEVIVVGAHVDHLGTEQFLDVMYPGADDNASGTAVMMALARALAAGGTRVKRTVLFAAWNAEELGLLGSRYYVNNAPSRPLGSTVAALSVDMVGRGDGQGLLFHGGTDQANAWLVNLANEAAKAERLGLTAVAQEPLFASDHAYFALVGIPAILTESTGDHPSYHQPSDTAASIEDEVLRSSTHLLWVLLRELATGNEARHGVSVPKRRSGLPLLVPARAPRPRGAPALQ